MSRRLQGIVPRRTARLPLDIRSFSTFVKKTNRSTLSVNDMQKLNFRAEDGLEHKFELILISMYNVDTVDSLKVVYSLSIRIEEFANALRSYDMIDTFTLPNDFTHNTIEDVYEPSTGATPDDLIRYYIDAPLSLVKKASDCITDFSDDTDVQDLF